MASLAALSACGGGGGSSGTPTPSDTSGSSAVTALKVTDTAIGTGAVAAAGANVSVKYTGWLYDVKTADLRGTQFESSTYTFKLGTGVVIQGWDQGIVGMKVGGKRTLVIPASMAYGSSARGPIPANAALVFDVELTAVN
ncbi:FKBP-type peptidyl-prolyl cis-trans isomerase [Paucibacter sp. APW11]|uniref:Peptidyl-prolyl cis-trans isomerase n=1 Tax=Roseateles aquae TaxID=3077235 RepID=A0ABU3PGG1_9BURK|nr:FKBP-type peptidyl-prolyl cis-trans isomerase [Paucibacter sp. APW11]MDT9001684.1 FKBP-type peptidyl-prolyl cis-trans isomerase [Paucibacter sp. APW11]